MLKTFTKDVHKKIFALINTKYYKTGVEILLEKPKSYEIKACFIIPKSLQDA